MTLQGWLLKSYLRTKKADKYFFLVTKLLFHFQEAGCMVSCHLNDLQDLY